MNYLNTLAKGLLSFIFIFSFFLNVSAQQAHPAYLAKKAQTKEVKTPLTSNLGAHTPAAKKVQSKKLASQKNATAPKNVEANIIVKTRPSQPDNPVKTALFVMYDNDEKSISDARKILRTYESQGFNVVTQKQYDSLLTKKASLNQAEKAKLEQQLTNSKILENIIQ